MSRQNKVNPAHYTQRGRLTQDDAARELTRQRSIGSQHAWQPVKKNMLPFASTDEEADRGAEMSEDTGSPAAGPSHGKAKPAARMTRKTGAKDATLAKAKQSGSAKTSTAKKTLDVGRVPRLVRHSLGEGGNGPGATSKAKTGKSAKAAAKTMSTKTTRKAVLARNVGGPALKPLRGAKRRKS